MNRKTGKNLMLLIAILATSVVLAGCKKENDIPSAETQINDTADETALPERVEAENQETEETSENPFDCVLGKYVAMATESEDEEEVVFEISKVFGNYYIEYMGYGFAGAEIEFIGECESTDPNKKIFNVKMYPFSGFSFAGEYWGTGGEECTITACSDGSVILDKSNPLWGDGEVVLTKSASSFVHSSVQNLQKNTTYKEILGTWAAQSERGGEKCYITLDFSEDGSFTAVNKVQDYPPQVYVGGYTVAQNDEGSEGEILCEMLAYGDMPYEWIVRYDKENECPVILEDYSLMNPFSNQEGDDILFKKIESGKETVYTLGPGKRTEQVKKDYEEYCSSSDDIDEEHEATREEVEALEEAIRIFPLFEEYTVNCDLSDVGISVLEKWRVYVNTPEEEYAGLKFEVGKAPLPLDHLDYENIDKGYNTDYVRIKTAVLDKALQDFFDTPSKVRREMGYDYTVDEDYAALWGFGYIVSYEGTDYEWESFDDYMSENDLIIDAVRTSGDITETCTENIKFRFRYNPDSIYNYSLIRFDVMDSDKVELKAGEDGCPYARWFYYQYDEFVYARDRSLV